MASPTDFGKKKLTGAHRRFLELASKISVNNSLTLVTSIMPTVNKNKNINHICISTDSIWKFPDHVSGMINVYKGLKHVKRKEIDCAISFNTYITVCYWLAGYRNIVSLFREDLIDYLKVVNTPKYKLFYFRIQEVLAVLFSKKIIVQCEHDKNQLIKRNKMFSKSMSQKVFVQINNVNTSWMRDVSSKKNKDSDIINILFIGDFSNIRKGHQILLPAVKRLIDEGVKIEAFIAGDGIGLPKYSKDYANYNNIHFLGRVSNIDQYLEIADCLLVPSLIDSCPNTVLEGLNAGVTVYGCRTGGIPALLENDDYMFEPTELDLYKFLKHKFSSNEYQSDSEKQVYLKEKLTFDWVERIESIIQGGY